MVSRLYQQAGGRYAVCHEDPIRESHTLPGRTAQFRVPPQLRKWEVGKGRNWCRPNASHSWNNTCLYLALIYFQSNVKHSVLEISFYQLTLIKTLANVAKKIPMPNIQADLSSSTYQAWSEVTALPSVCPAVSVDKRKPSPAETPRLQTREIKEQQNTVQHNK